MPQIVIGWTFLTRAEVKQAYLQLIRLGKKPTDQKHGVLFDALEVELVGDSDFFLALKRQQSRQPDIRTQD